MTDAAPSPKRYEFESYTAGYYTDHEMNERDDGEYVKWEDYEKVTAEAEGLRGERDAAVAGLKEVISYDEGNRGPVHGRYVGYQICANVAREALKAIAAAGGAREGDAK